MSFSGTLTASAFSLGFLPGFSSSSRTIQRKNALRLR